MGEPPKLTTRLGDWYANLRIVRRQHLALAVSSVTLLPVLLPAAPFKTLPARVAEGVAQVLDALGIDEQGIAAEVAAMRECVVTTTNDRQILGSMNDFANMLDFTSRRGRCWRWRSSSQSPRAARWGWRARRGRRLRYSGGRSCRW
jgi:hypothetical protein